jgi:PleD family two-component response regulator
MSISVGYVVREPHEQITLDQLLERADSGLMQSKKDGRNRVRSAV